MGRGERRRIVEPVADHQHGGPTDVPVPPGRRPYRPGSARRATHRCQADPPHPRRRPSGRPRAASPACHRQAVPPRRRLHRAGSASVKLKRTGAAPGRASQSSGLAPLFRLVFWLAAWSLSSSAAPVKRRLPSRISPSGSRPRQGRNREFPGHPPPRRRRERPGKARELMDDGSMLRGTPPDEGPESRTARRHGVPAVPRSGYRSCRKRRY